MRTKNFFLTLLITAMIFVPAHLGAQITIGSGEAPQSFSVLELISNNESGLRLPQMTNDQRNAMVATPEFQAEKTGRALGLKIYNTTTNCINTWNGRRWISSCTRCTGVMIEGVCWATRNVDYPHTFAESPESLGMLYQWGRRVGWSSSDPLISSNRLTTWNDEAITAGRRAIWPLDDDPCPLGWRVPTYEEMQSLLDAGNMPYTMNGVDGFLFGTAPNQIFLPDARVRNPIGGLSNAVIGRYWTSTVMHSNGAYALNRAGNARIGVSFAAGLFVRCVAE